MVSFLDPQNRNTPFPTMRMCKICC